MRWQSLCLRRFACCRFPRGLARLRGRGATALPAMQSPRLLTTRGRESRSRSCTHELGQVWGSVLQKSVPAEADGAVHITPAAKAAAAAPTVAINTLVFLLGFLFAGRRRHSLSLLVTAGQHYSQHYANPRSQIFLLLGRGRSVSPTRAEIIAERLTLSAAVRGILSTNSTTSVPCKAPTGHWRTRSPALR